MRSSVLLAAALGLVSFGAPTRGEITERILAVVDGRPLLLTEVQLLERVGGLLRALALEALIDERLMFRDAARLPQTEVTSEDEQQAFESLLAKWPAGEAPGSETELRRLARRQARILKYVEFRFRPQVRVDDDAVRRAYEDEYGGKADAPPLESVAEGLRAKLADRDLGDRIEAWVKDLRSSAQIRYNP